jgi:DNA (cytosine-5)-methyltransferase 1
MVPHHRGSPLRPGAHPDTPDATDLTAVRKFIARPRSRPTAIDLFSGAGGLSLGLERAGFDVLVGADSDEWAVRTHDANLPGLAWCGDLSDPSEFLATLDVWGVRQVDLVAGGVPCQPFSRAGSSRIRDLVELGERGSHDHRADLWSSFVSVVEAVEPASVLVENVPDLARWNDGAVLMALYESLERLGYRVEARVVDGFRHGIPQHRQRLILIGVTGNRRPLWPVPVDDYVNLRDAIGDLPPIPRAQRNEQLPYDPRRQSAEYQLRMRSHVPPDERGFVFEHICRDVRPDDMEAFRLLEEGQTYADLPEHLRRYRVDVFTDKYKRLTWSELSRTITAHIAKDGYWYIHPEQHRTLSVREAARLQSFPDEFRFAGTQTHRYRQIGNAVPAILGEVIGQSLLATLESPLRQRALSREQTRDLLLRWRARGDGWSPPWRSEDTSPWLALAAELSLTRMRPAEAERAFRLMEKTIPTPTRLLALDDPVRALGNLGVTADRSKGLVAIAEDLGSYFDGRVPDDESLVRLLPGVGDYVARATLCFGFGRRQILVDQGTARVASRVADHEDTRRFQIRLDLHRMAGAVGPDAEFNRALLDLARDICRPVEPRCGICPIRTKCRTGRSSTEQPTLTTEELAAA